MNIEERRKTAENYFELGYNCSQAVALAFSDVLPAEKQMLVRMMSSFGGGMGRLREVCGAVTGMFAVAGLLYGYSDPSLPDEKKTHYARIQHLAHKFEDQTGSIVCREILGLKSKHSDPAPDERTAEYYRKRPCKEMVGIAAQIMAEYIAENE